MLVDASALAIAVSVTFMSLLLARHHLHRSENSTAGLAAHEIIAFYATCGRRCHNVAWAALGFILVLAAMAALLMTPLTAGSEACRRLAIAAVSFAALGVGFIAGRAATSIRQTRLAIAASVSPSGISWLAYLAAC
jgi:hypothetical protein